MTIALLVIGNGRLDYLHSTVDAAMQHLPTFDHYLMIDDSGDAAVRRELSRNYPDFMLRSHPENWGMARAVQDGFDAVLDTDADYVFWLEEDFLILKPPPTYAATEALSMYPQVAQILFQRQCLSPPEHDAGSVANALPTVDDHGCWKEQDTIFSLNPCLIPRRVLEYGWPEGPIGVGNETGFTNKLLAAGFTFGVWTSGGQYVEHEGWNRAPNWKL